MKKKILCMLSAIIICAMLVGCAMGKGDYNPSLYGEAMFWDAESGDGNMFDEIVENPFVDCTAENNKQAVSLTVNTAAFPIMKRYLKENMQIPKNAVKIEEIINYFDYDYAAPENGKTLALGGSVTDTPWNPETKLVTLGVQAETADISDVKNNIVFLVDVSGSMAGKDRIDLVKQSVIALSETLSENDVVSLVTYASGTKVIFEGVRGNNTPAIEKALKQLKVGGSTYGAGGIDLAYQKAFQYQKGCDNSVIIIATDGDFNVGASTPEELKELISENRRRGVYLSALGFGFNNLSDSNMQQIVASGQGAYAYIDSIDSARAALCGNRDSVLYFVAEEAKAQIEFNPETVEKFRLIGFENKMLTTEEFENPDTPAGALSSGSQVTAIFEIKLREGASGEIGEFVTAFRERGGIEELRETLTIDETHIDPAVGAANAIKKADTDFISAVVEASLLVRNSEYKANASYEAVLGRLNSLGLERGDAKYEFIDFVNMLVR